MNRSKTRNVTANCNSEPINYRELALQQRRQMLVANSGPTGDIPLLPPTTAQTIGRPVHNSQYASAQPGELLYRGSYPAEALPVPVLNFNKPSYGYGGQGNISSYPVRGTVDPRTGTIDTQPHADARGDDYHDPSSLVSRGDGPFRPPQGSRGRNAGPANGYLPEQYRDPATFDQVDLGSSEGQGTYHVAGGDSTYSVDQIMGGEHLQGNYNGVQPGRMPDQDLWAGRRQFGSQSPPSNNSETMLVPPTCNYAQWVKEDHPFSKPGRAMVPGRR